MPIVCRELKYTLFMFIYAHMHEISENPLCLTLFNTLCQEVLGMCMVLVFQKSFFKTVNIFRPYRKVAIYIPFDSLHIFVFTETPKIKIFSFTMHNFTLNAARWFMVNSSQCWIANCEGIGGQCWDNFV